MPNWCHNTLTVTGDPAEVRRFIDRARPPDEALREAYDTFRPLEGEEKPAFEEWAEQQREEQPLSFASHAPEPGEEELAELAIVRVCHLCAGTGKRPQTDAEAERLAAETGHQALSRERYDLPPTDRPCNGCSGSGRETVAEGWYEWRLQNWGCKWDASFSRPFMALGAKGMDVKTSVDAQGVQTAEGVAIYKFDTPWSPPTPWLERASTQHPELEFQFRYGEAGEGFAGERKIVAGVTVEDEELEVEDVLAPEEMWF